jgi:hypothetical protein
MMRKMDDGKDEESTIDSGREENGRGRERRKRRLVTLKDCIRIELLLL